jgi:hypothetical protein
MDWRRRRVILIRLLVWCWRRMVSWVGSMRRVGVNWWWWRVVNWVRVRGWLLMWWWRVVDWMRVRVGVHWWGWW